MHKLIWQLFISHHISDSLNYSRPAIPFVLLKLLIRTMCVWKIKLFVICGHKNCYGHVRICLITRRKWYIFHISMLAPIK